MSSDRESISPFKHSALEEIGRSPGEYPTENGFWVPRGWAFHYVLVPPQDLSNWTLDDLILFLQTFSTEMAGPLAVAEQHERVGSIEAKFLRGIFAASVSNARRFILLAPGMTDLRSICQVHFGDELTIENVRKLRGMVGDGALIISKAVERLEALLRPKKPRKKVERSKETEARDKWIYELCVQGVPLWTIKTKLDGRTTWDPIESEQGIDQAARRYAKRHKLPAPPPRRSK